MYTLLKLQEQFLMKNVLKFSKNTKPMYTGKKIRASQVTTDFCVNRLYMIPSQALKTNGQNLKGMLMTKGPVKTRVSSQKLLAPTI